MKSVLVTGANGFIGKNLIEALKPIDNINVLSYDIGQSRETLTRYLNQAEVIYHLAGVNRPKEDTEFKTGNADFTEDICQELNALNRKVKIIFTSSIQVERKENAYGHSKMAAENALKDFGKETHSQISIYRLKNVFWQMV